MKTLIKNLETAMLLFSSYMLILFVIELMQK